MSTKLLTAAQAADHLELTLKNFYELLRRRRLAGDPIRTHRLGRSLRFKLEDLDAAMTVEQPRHLSIAGGRRAS